MAALPFSGCIHVHRTKSHVMLGVQKPLTQTKIPCSCWEDLTAVGGGYRKPGVSMCSGGLVSPAASSQLSLTLLQEAHEAIRMTQNCKDNGVLKSRVSERLWKPSAAHSSCKGKNGAGGRNLTFQIINNNNKKKVPNKPKGEIWLKKHESCREGRCAWTKYKNTTAAFSVC